MVSRPSVIILDEPTSGLDSNKAAKVLRILKKLTTFGHTIIFTLHQPSYLQFARLDRLIVLNRGEIIYQGEASLVESYMKSIAINVQNTSTISDFFMMEISNFKQEANDYHTPFNRNNYLIKQERTIGL